MLTKVDLLMLEMLANCNWERPLYLAISVGSVSKLKFDNYFVQEGLAFRFTPFDYKKWGDVGENRLYAVDVERLYDNVMNRYKNMVDWILRGSIWMKQHYARVGIIAGFLRNLPKN